MSLKIRFYIIIPIILIITLVNLVVGYLYLDGPLRENKVIIIENNLSIDAISQKLFNHNIIKYPKIFSLIGHAYIFKDTLKSGEYRFTEKVSPLQVIRKLASGKSIIHKLMIPEGYIVSDILNKIEEEQRLLGKITSNVPEGFLLPSTYFYSYGDYKEAIIHKMKISMSEALDEAMTKLSKDSPLKTRMEVLTLASIVEKEAGNDTERAIIAGVFINRLKKGMKLQADPTSAYAVTEGKHVLNRPLSKKDLALESPYNTYYIKGLPPGPIACPGKKSLNAVVMPAVTSALYFVIDGQGGHNFSDDLNSHNFYVRKIRQLQKN